MNTIRGYKTYAVAILMILIGLLELLGVDIPAFEEQDAGPLGVSGLAILFLRAGIKNVLKDV